MALALALQPPRIISHIRLHQQTRRHHLLQLQQLQQLPRRWSSSSSSSNSTNALPNIPIFQALKDHDPNSLCAIHSLSRRTFTYGNLIGDVLRARHDLRKKAGDVAGERVGFLAENSYDYVVTMLSIFASRGIALPLSPAFPTSELQYIMDNSSAKVLLSTEKYAEKADQILVSGLAREPIFDVRPKIKTGSSERIQLDLEPEENQPKNPEQPISGMMLYTSGTTNRPKGVLIPESALAAQAQSLLQAWKYSPQDRLLHLLPLHHIHGVVNAIVAPVFAGSSIEFMYPFNTDAVWKRLAEPFISNISKDSSRSSSSSNKDNDSEKPSKITFLTAVPTVYNRLMASFPTLTPEIQSAGKQAISPENLRLNISGSAALPTPTKSKWTELSNGNVLLERFGMTEVGMAISCGLEMNDRVDGSVGWALPGVEARLVDTETNKVIPVTAEKDDQGRPVEGEIQLRGETIFHSYWANEKATRESFVDDVDGGKPWFKTGDVASRQVVCGAGSGSESGSGAWARGPMYFISGRKSVDIIKTGGEKVSALEVERELLSLPQITEAAVLGLPHEQWGQKIAAVVVLHPDAATSGRNGKKWGPMDMRRALKDRLAGYKIPQEMRVLESIPRNAMGKVNKKALVKEVFG